MTLTYLVSAHIDQFVRSRTKTHGKKPRDNTIIAHKSPLERIAAAYDADHNDAAGLTVNFLKDWFLSYEETGVGISAVNGALTAVSEFMRFLRDDNRISRDDLESWQAFHRKNFRRWKRTTSHRKYLRPDELQDLFSAIAFDSRFPAQRDRDMMFFASILLGPSRLGELHLLNIADVHYINDGNPAYVLLIVKTEYAKDHEEHRLMIFDGSSIGGIDIFPYFQSYHQWRMDQPDTSPDSPYFVAIRPPHLGERPSVRNWHKVFDTHANRCGLAITSHWLRHTYGEIVSSHVERRDLRQIYGHSSDKTTEGYTDHANDGRLRKARQNAAKAISNY